MTYPEFRAQVLVCANPGELLAELFPAESADALETKLGWQLRQARVRDLDALVDKFQRAHPDGTLEEFLEALPTLGRGIGAAP
jgi:hypothetical protein